MLFNKQQKILILNKYIRQEPFQLKQYKNLESINSSEINRTVINQTKKNSINLKLKNKKKLAANKNYEFLMSKI